MEGPKGSERRFRWQYAAIWPFEEKELAGGDERIRQQRTVGSDIFCRHGLGEAISNTRSSRRVLIPLSKNVHGSNYGHRG